MRPGRQRILLYLALAAVAAVVLLYPLYLVAGNAYLRHGGLARLLNRRPERLRITWGSAWTVWPGVVHVQGFELRGQSRAVQSWLTVDRGIVDVDLPSLARRELRVGSLVGSGVVFHARRRLDAPPRSVPPRPALAPPIPGLANPPQPPPEALYPARGNRPPWRLVFSGVQLADVREIWIEGRRCPTSPFTMPTCRSARRSC